MPPPVFLVKEAEKGTNKYQTREQMQYADNNTPYEILTS